VSTVTAVVPTIPGRHDLFERAIASIVAQTRPVDAILTGCDTEGRGAAYARNVILAGATTDFVAFLDDDDTWHPNHIEGLMSVADDADVVYPWFDGLHSKSLAVSVNGRPHTPLGVPFGPEQADHLRHANFIPVTFLARTALVQQVGGFEKPWWLPPESPCEDWGLLLKLLDAGARFTHYPHITWTWNGHADQTNGQSWKRGAIHA
jgi:glycosyltransferase involved in cell wall biosynthesis